MTPSGTVHATAVHAALAAPASKAVTMNELGKLRPETISADDLKKMLPKNEKGSKVVFSMTDYAEDIIAHWKDLTGKVNLKSASTPFVPDGTLLADDWEEKGQLCAQSCSMCMKIL